MSILFMLLLSVAGPPATDAGVGDAIEKVKQIVNRPVTSLPRDPGAHVAIYSPGWFHEGAVKPNFRSVDIRKTQQFPYDSHQYVTSDLNPGVMFRGQDLEFNVMTKYFYTDRSLPKRRLTEEEMLEINRLYRIIARGERPAASSGTPKAANSSPSSTAALGYAAAGVLALALAVSLYRRRSARTR